MSDQGPRQQSAGSAGFQESCGVCGGDRRIGNSFGLTTTCPSCHGSGRRAEVHGFRDVTKTKPSHFQQSNKAPGVGKKTWPTTFEGGQLATEVRDCASVTADAKTKLIREIIDYEQSHGQCTST